MVWIDDAATINNVRMDRRALRKLCDMICTHGKLRELSNVGIDEMVASFLKVLARDGNDGVVGRQLDSCGFNAVLCAVLRLHDILYKKPEPMRENCSDENWKWFKNCLGALDRAYIQVTVPVEDWPRYRTRSNEIATTVLGVCSHDMQFIYVLAGWEGSAADYRVLRNAISRKNGLKVPKGYYYLCNAYDINCEGFLGPYRGQQYNSYYWRQDRQPTTPQEFFNMKHSSARNVIERAFDLLKGRWRILGSRSSYSIEIQVRILLACSLLHNHIIREMPVDSQESIPFSNISEGQELEGDHITHLESSDAWNEWRDILARETFDHWRASRHES
ncbi:protein ANTAGONIST OF LIKE HETEROCHROMATIN PROTEIN 1-like [Castanea sativa]|uniref:protein ANTAGONIST OF LIKE HETEROCHROMATIN PROTEIN 1-like n=1 Tax=Castanea sativa TaxID=21020 RepID=UPI003F651B93